MMGYVDANFVGDTFLMFLVSLKHFFGNGECENQTKNIENIENKMILLGQKYSTRQCINY